MTFADPAILAALCALAIPVAVHLLGRRQARRVLLPTAQFADGAHHEARGRLWVKRLGLLALRMAVAGLLVLALAGPKLTTQAQPRAAVPQVGTGFEIVSKQEAPAARTMHILVVDAAEEKDVQVRSADLVAATFAGDTATKQVTRCRAADVSRETLAGADVVFWIGSQAPPSIEPLEAYLARGNLIWMPADAQPPDAALARTLGVEVGNIETLPDGMRIDPAGYTSDLLAAFEGGTSGDLAAPVIRGRMVLIVPLAGIGFRDGVSAIVDRRTDSGRMTALAFGPAPLWGDWASRAEFVLLMHSLAAPPKAGSPHVTPLSPSLSPTPSPAAPKVFVDLAVWFALATAAALAAETVLAAVQCVGRVNRPDSIDLPWSVARAAEKSGLLTRPTF